MGHVNKSKVDEWLKPDNLMLISSWARDGYTQEDIARKMNVNNTLFSRWKRENEALSEALSKGKEVIDYKVENALLKRALGYKVTEVKTVLTAKPDKDGNRVARIEKTEKEIAPDPTSIAIWLNNRKPEQWRRNRDNMISLSDEDSKITVNIIKQEKGGKSDKSKKPSEEVEDLSDEDWEKAIEEYN